MVQIGCFDPSRLYSVIKTKVLASEKQNTNMQTRFRLLLHRIATKPVVKAIRIHFLTALERASPARAVVRVWACGGDPPPRGPQPPRHLPPSPSAKPASGTSPLRSPGPSRFCGAARSRTTPFPPSAQHGLRLLQQDTGTCSEGPPFCRPHRTVVSLSKAWFARSQAVTFKVVPLAIDPTVYLGVPNNDWA